MSHYEPGLAVGIASHYVIAAAFVGIAFVITPRFRFFANRVAGMIARISAAAFVLSSAALHVELGTQAWLYGVSSKNDPRGVGTWFVQWHGLFVAVTEAVAAVVFLVLAAGFVSTMVVNRTAVQSALDERIRQIEQEIARRESARGGT